MRKPFRGALEVASGAPLLVDAEIGRGHRLDVLSQGEFPVGAPPAAPALPNTGSLLRVNWNGTLTPIATELDVPTSVEFIGTKAFVVTLGGEVWTLALP